MGSMRQPTRGALPAIPAGAAPATASAAGRTASAAPAATRPAANAVAAGSATTPDARSRELVRRLELSGLASLEAGNVVAYLLGLRPVASGWRVTEIDHLRFLRALVADGRLES